MSLAQDSPHHGSPLQQPHPRTKQTPNDTGCFWAVTTGLGCFLGKHCPKPAANEHVGWGCHHGWPSGCTVPKGLTLAAHPPSPRSLLIHVLLACMAPPVPPEPQKPLSQEPESVVSTNPAMEPVWQPKKAQALCPPSPMVQPSHSFRGRGLSPVRRAPGSTGSQDPKD